MSLLHSDKLAAGFSAAALITYGRFSGATSGLWFYGQIPQTC